MDKRVKMVLASLFFCALMVGCAEDRDTMPVPDMQEIIGNGGIEDLRYKGGNKDTTNNS